MNEQALNTSNQPLPIAVSESVYRGILAVRDSGLTNMFDRPVAARLAEELGYPAAARWIEENPDRYAEGILWGFAIDR